jgi:hypothetical protein
MDPRPGRQPLVEQGMHRRYHRGGTFGANHERRTRALGRLAKRGRRVHPARHEHPGNRQRKQAFRRFLLGLSRKRLGVTELGFTEHLQPRGHHAARVPDQREPRFLDTRMVDAAIETGGPRDQADVEPETRVVQNLANREASRDFGSWLAAHGHLACPSRASISW